MHTHEVSLSPKTVKTYYSLRPPESISHKINHLNALQSARLGKSVPLSKTIFRALQHGLDIVLLEETNENLRPFDPNLTEREKLVILLKDMIDYAHQKGYPN